MTTNLGSCGVDISTPIRSELRTWANFKPLFRIYRNESFRAVISRDIIDTRMTLYDTECIASKGSSFHIRPLLGPLFLG